MTTTTRTQISLSLPVALADAKDHTRITSSDDDSAITNIILAAATDVEAKTGLTLLSQTITFTTDEDPGCTIALPVGPVASGALAEVAVIELDGTATPVTSGFWLEGGRYPRLHFTTTPGEWLRITYIAGFGDDANALPRDLTMAICDQMARHYDERGGISDKGPALSAHTARLMARYQRVGM